MNDYNERWSKEKSIEYRKLKRQGYTDKMLKEHFGEDIYYSGMYNKNAHIIPYDYFTQYFENKIDETFDGILISNPSGINNEFKDNISGFADAIIQYKV